jgi:type II secretory pathway component PulF
MPKFSYQARTATGHAKEGIVDSVDRTGVVLSLERQGYFPISIALLGGPPGTGQPDLHPDSRGPEFAQGRKSNPTRLRAPGESPAGESRLRLSHAQRLMFTEQLAYLLSVGMTLDESLGVLARRLKQPTLQRLTRSLHGALVDGRSFSQALREHPRVFSPLYANLVQAGEASGSLPSVLGRLVEHLSEMKALRDRVQQALIYPAILSVVGIALVIVFVTVMVPQITTLLGRTAPGSTLPVPTQMLLAAHKAVVHYWWAAALAIVLLLSAFKAITSQPAGRIWWDRTKLSIPGIGQVLAYRFYAQFARTLATLLVNGVPLLRAMELLENIAGNRFVQLRMAEARAALVEGATLSSGLGRQGLFPELYLDMVAVGEQSGRFGETMGMVATVYERELDRRVKIASAIIPPIIIVIIAILVGAVVFGILSALFSLTSSMRVGGG